MGFPVDPDAVISIVQDACDGTTSWKEAFQTCKVIRWLRSLQLDTMDGLAMNQLLVQWKLWEEQLLVVDRQITSRFLANPDAQLLLDPNQLTADGTAAITAGRVPPSRRAA